MSIAAPNHFYLKRKRKERERGGEDLTKRNIPKKKKVKKNNTANRKPRVKIP